ncbi:MAG: hypothetical protein ACTSVI_04760 [Promethearchaeota archaeon]
MASKKPFKSFEEKNIDEQIDEILGYMDIIKKNLMGPGFNSLGVKIYNLETYEPERCPECGKLRQKFFLLLQPGEDLFDFSREHPFISDYKIFCLHCTKNIKPGNKVKKEQDS